MSPFRLFGRLDTAAADAVPPAEHAAWYGGAAPEPQTPAYRPPHSGGSSRRRQAPGHAPADAAARGLGPRGEPHPPTNGRRGGPAADGGTAARQGKARRGWGSRRAASGRAAVDGHTAGPRDGGAAASRDAGGTTWGAAGGAPRSRAPGGTWGDGGAAGPRGGTAPTPWGAAGATPRGGPLTSGDPRVDGDPPTDPRGFPPVPAFSPAAPPHPAEAAALAGAFAVDYLSWDEDDPERRGRVLVDYLATPGRDPARLGWTGEGRQRAEFALPGLVRPDGDGRVLVDVRVRVTPYVAVGEHGAGPDTGDARVPGALAAAPAPTGRGWRSMASTWIRLSVPVTFDGGRMVVDAWDETLGEEPPPRTGPAGPADDHTLADDDPLQEPVGGAR